MPVKKSSKMKVKGKRTLKNGAVAGYVYYSKEKKWKWRIIGRDKKQKGGNGLLNMNNEYNLGLLFNNGYDIKYLKYCNLKYIRVNNLKPLPLQIQEYNNKIEKYNFIIKFKRVSFWV